MIIGVVKEARPGETRVAATPATVAQLLKLGYDVVVEPGAGWRRASPTRRTSRPGRAVGDALAADIVFGVNAPSTEQLDRLREGATLVSLLSPALNPDLVEDLARRPITALAMDAVPRISRAQSLDVLSSMANIAGYRAVVEAAHVFGRFFTGQVTAAGKVPPAKVLVAGAGVAGLAAIGAAGQPGRDRAGDRPASRGGRPGEVAGRGVPLGRVPADVEVSATGYAKEMGEDYKAREAALYAEQAADVDIIITTALIPGRPAPRLITAEMVATMKPGSVIVDMAAANGGNVEGTVAGEAVVTDNGVTIIGYTDLAGRLPAQASQLYGTNLVNLMKLMTPGKDGAAGPGLRRRGAAVDDRGPHDGELTWPPPPVQVSAAPAPAAATAPDGRVSPAKQPMSPAAAVRHRRGRRPRVLFLLAALSPPALLGHLTVFALAIVIGYYVIGHVHHALHTPLMSVTNAISGIIVVGALLQIGHGDAADHGAVVRRRSCWPPSTSSVASR